MVDDQDKEIGARIKKRRKQLGLSIGTLAANSHSDAGTISRTENGHTSITLDKAIELARALAIELPDLIAGDAPVEQALPRRATDFIADAQALKSSVEFLLALHRVDDSAARNLLAEALNKVVQHQSNLAPGEFQAVFDARMVQLLLAKQDLVRYKIVFPVNCVVRAVPLIYELGGAISRDDLKIYLSAVLSELSEDSPRYQLLDRQNKDVVRRLQSETPDRVRLVDVKKLGDELGIDLIGLYWRAEGPQEDQGIEQYGHEEAMLISLFITIYVWFDSVGMDKGNLVEVMRIVDPGDVGGYPLRQESQ